MPKTKTKKSVVKGIKEGDAEAIAQRDAANKAANSKESEQNMVKTLYEELGGNKGVAIAGKVGLNTHEETEFRTRQKLTSEQRKHRDMMLTVLQHYIPLCSDQFVQDKRRMVEKATCLKSRTAKRFYQCELM